MNDLLTFTLSVFTGFFAVMNPIANTPVFLSLVEGMDDDEQKQVARTATINAFFIVSAFVILGKYIFDLFGITIPAFKITGGILIFYVGFEMLMSKKSAVHSSGKKIVDSEVGISPLAIPILAGPGTIVTAMNHVTSADYLHIGIVVLVFAFIIFLTYLAFRVSETIVRKIGHNLIAVIGKLMGLILAIIGSGMLVDGIKLAFDLK